MHTPYISRNLQRHRTVSLRQHGVLVFKHHAISLKRSDVMTTEFIAVAYYIGVGNGWG